MKSVSAAPIVADLTGSPVERELRELLHANGGGRMVPAAVRAADAIRHATDELTLALHEITAALITTQDRLAALRALTRANVTSLGQTEAEVEMLHQAMALTDSDTVVLTGRGSFQFVGSDRAAAAEIAGKVIDAAAHRPATRTPFTIDDATAVVAPLGPSGATNSLFGFARTAGPPFTTGDLQMIEAVVGATEMMHTLTRLHSEAVQRAAMEREHQAASTLAQAVLSSPIPDLDGIDIFASSVPASLAGGDFLVLSTVGNVLWFAVGDVAGKGLPAAIVMTRAVSATRVAFLTHPADDPASALAAVSAELFAYLDDVGLFVTMVLGSCVVGNGELRLCNAGHSPVLTVSRGVVRAIPASVPPVGVLAAPSPRTELIPFGTGDLLVLGSDGLAEQQDPDGNLFGYERLAELAGEGPAGASLLGPLILDAVAAHADGTPSSDDCTLVVLSSADAP